jgi:geranylgeranyl reductase family protein
VNNATDILGMGTSARHRTHYRRLTPAETRPALRGRNTTMWDIAVVGAGPAGTAAALGALAADPGLSVLLVDRSDFPRDKSCGDGIAPHVLDVLAEVGVRDLLSDWTPVHRLHLGLGHDEVDRRMRRPAYVVPRAVFDARLVAEATRAGAQLRRHRVRDVRTGSDSVTLDGDISAGVVIGADGAHSLVRRATGLSACERPAIAIRGYAPVPPARREQQLIVFGDQPQLCYAWSFDRGDGLANIGYGELLEAEQSGPSRRAMLGQLESLLPGATRDATQWRGHHLPLSSWRWQQPNGRVLLVGDAANLVNPVTGEGIYYAVATGVLAGRSAAEALRAGRPAGAGARHRRAVRTLLARHLRHTALASRLVQSPAVLRAGVRAAGADQRLFDDLVEMGLGRGVITRRLMTPLAAGLPALAVSRLRGTRG